MFFGSLAGHALTRSAYDSSPIYSASSTTTIYQDSVARSTRPLDEEQHLERLVLGADGRCTYVGRDSEGNQYMQELAPSQCY